MDVKKTNRIIQTSKGYLKYFKSDEPYFTEDIKDAKKMRLGLAQLYAGLLSTNWKECLPINIEED